MLAWHASPTPPAELWPILAHLSMLPVDASRFSATHRRIPGTYRCTIHRFLPASITCRCAVHLCVRYSSSTSGYLIDKWL